MNFIKDYRVKTLYCRSLNNVKVLVPNINEIYLKLYNVLRIILLLRIYITMYKRVTILFDDFRYIRRIKHSVLAFYSAQRVFFFFF